ncbi:hypothetical protein K1719_024282 [Acacia pycnantha]|nr:hypothetical protein K1719_024282 [Acacia pycnantha]
MEIIRGTLNRIDREDLTLGDHIYSWRMAFVFVVYAHHGIYVGEGMVIHFTTRDQDGPGNTSSSTVSRSANYPCPTCGHRSNHDGVIHTCLDCFLKGGYLYRYKYGVFYPIPSDPLRSICTLCTSDPPEAVPKYMSRLEWAGSIVCGISYSVRAVADSSVVSLPLGFLTTGFSGLAQVGCGRYCISRLVSDIGVRRDVAKEPPGLDEQAKANKVTKEE